MQSYHCRPHYPSIVVHYAYLQGGSPAQVERLSTDGSEVLCSDVTAEDGDLKLSTPVPFLLRADRVVGWQHFQAAVLNALDACATHSSRLKTLKSEIFSRISYDWGINEARRFFGANPAESPTSLLAIVGSEGIGDDLLAHYAPSFKILHGPEANTDVESLQKHYKIKDAELALRGGLAAAVLMRVSTKGI